MNERESVEPETREKYSDVRYTALKPRGSLGSLFLKALLICVNFPARIDVSF